MELMDIIEKIIGWIVILGGVSGTLITAISVSKKNKAESETNLVKANNEHTKAEGEKLKNEVELTEKLQQMSKDMLSHMEKEMAVIKEEIMGVKADLLKTQIEKKRLIDAGIILIEAIEAGLDIRRKNQNADYCNACKISDEALLVKLNEVKNLFTGG